MRKGLLCEMGMAEQVKQEKERKTHTASAGSSCFESLETSAIWPSCFTSPVLRVEWEGEISLGRKGGRMSLPHTYTRTVVLPRRIDEEDDL
jgi:hypothetical protein